MTILRLEQTEVKAICDGSHFPSGFIDWTATLSFVDGTRTFTITGAHNVYIDGILYPKTTDSIVIPNTVGTHWIYYNSIGVLSSSTSEPEFYYPFIATVYWDGTQGVEGEERHGTSYPWTVHEQIHKTVGARYNTGLTGTFTNTTFSIAAGSYFDEDIFHQFLAAMTTCNIFYKNGSANFTFDKAQTNPYKTVTGTIQYNNVNALANVPVNSYVAYWVFITNDITTPVMTLMGQRVDANLPAARINNTYESLVFSQLPYQEAKVLYRVIFRNVGGTPTYIETQDMRYISNLPAGTYLATSHNLLTEVDLASTNVTYGHVSDTTQTFYGDKDFVGSTSLNNIVRIDGTDSQYATGAHQEFYTSGDTTRPRTQLLNWSPDHIELNFDCYYNGTNYISSDAGTNFQIIKQNDKLKLKVASSVPVGNTIASFSDGIMLAHDNTVGLYTDSTSSALQVGNGAKAFDVFIAAASDASHNVGFKWESGGTEYWRSYIPASQTYLDIYNTSGSITVSRYYVGGSNTKPYQPYFNAYRNGDVLNVMGGAANYDIPFNAERIDNRTAFNTGTGVFTAPTTGKYILSACVIMGGLDATNTTALGRIITSNKSYRIGYVNPYQARTIDGTNAYAIVGSVEADMDAADTAYVQVYATGNATIDLLGSASDITWFTGGLLY